MRLECEINTLHVIYNLDTGDTECQLTLTVLGEEITCVAPPALVAKLTSGSHKTPQPKTVPDPMEDEPPESPWDVGDLEEGYKIEQV